MEIEEIQAEMDSLGFQMSDKREMIERIEREMEVLTEKYLSLQQEQINKIRSK